MDQDFTKKMVIVLNKKLEPWEVTNTIGHCAAYLGNKMKAPFDTGDFFITKDGVNHPRNSQFPIIALRAKPAQLHTLASVVRESGVLYMGFLREMIESTNDEEIVQVLSKKIDEEVEYLGIGVFGDNETIDKLTKKFSLWK